MTTCEKCGRPTEGFHPNACFRDQLQTKGVIEECELVALGRRAGMREARTDAETDLRRLRWGVVANAGRLSGERKPRWSHVMDASSFGSTSAREACTMAGFDPDEMVGGDAEIGRRCGDG